MTAPTLEVVVPALALTTWLVVVAVLLALAVVTLVCVGRARRLDRLHRRTDAARAGLADALERRATVALRVADTADRPQGSMRSDQGRSERPQGSMRRGAAALREAADDARTACRAGVRSAGADLEPCEAAENTLTRRLGAVDRALLPTALVEELADAEQLVLLARRVYNDAVRDTLDLRSRRLVRGLRLAGTAPAPAYFEIADPARRDHTVPPPFAGAASPAGGPPVIVAPEIVPPGVVAPGAAVSGTGASG